MAVLLEDQGPHANQQYSLDRDCSILGRHFDCEIVLDVGAVSRQHAKILREDQDFYIEDLDSRNGTYLNGIPIKKRELLSDGDRLRICGLSFMFYQDQAPQLPLPSLDGSSMAMIVEDGEGPSQATIQTKLDVSSSVGFRLSVNPEVKLSALIEITKSLTKALSLDEVLPKLLDGLFKIFVQADRGFVALLASPSGPLIPRAVKHRRAGAEDTIRISRTIVNEAMESKEAILSADATSDTRFVASQSIADFRIRSMMCAPLVDSEDNALGVIQIDTLDQRSRFEENDLEVLASVAGQAAFAIQSAQLYEDSLKQRAIERDLELAYQVQKALLPEQRPKVDGYHFFDFYEPADQVGGDFYGYVELPGGRLGIVLADVSGKGISAALLMAKLSGDVRYCLASESDPGAAVRRINATLDHSGFEDRFVTFVLAILDPEKHEVTVVNAGHMAPLLRFENRNVVEIGSKETGPPLGIDFKYEYQQHTVKLSPGDSITLFTDGFSEAMNSNETFYTLKQLRTQVGTKIDNVSDLGRHILDNVRQFVGGHPQSDDMCLVCFGRVQKK